MAIGPCALELIRTYIDSVANANALPSVKCVEVFAYIVVASIPFRKASAIVIFPVIVASECSELKRMI